MRGAVNLKIAVIQTNPIVGDIEHNFQNILSLAKPTLKQGASLVVTPELSLLGYPPKDLLSLKSLLKRQQVYLEKFLEFTKVNNCSILVGGIEQNPGPGKPFFNSIFVISKGILLGTVRKSRIPSYDVFEEDRFFQPGNSPTSNPFQVEGLKFRVVVCEDLWNTTQAFGVRDLRTYPSSTHPLFKVQKDFDFLVHVSASPYWKKKIQTRKDLIAAYASKLNSPIICVNQVGANDEVVFDGSSFCVLPDRSICASLPSFEETSLTFEIQGQKSTIRKVDESETVEWQFIEQAIVLGIKDYFKKNNVKQALIGMSGGIDSALVATLSAKALGSENVKGILLPSAITSKLSIEDGIDQCHRLKIQHELIPIAGWVESLSASLLDSPSGLAYENLQSRLRGIALMSLSNKTGSLVISTGNKSELAMGYSTLYGDMCGALLPIGDLYKTEVYGLSHFLNLQTPGLISNSILQKPPTAELALNQKDEDSLPSYDVLDGLLYEIIENQGASFSGFQSWNKILGERFTAQTIANKMKAAEFKRFQAPPIIKLSQRSFGKSWRMPLSSGEWVLT
jgi:NAD+ synthase (glutamine-hydrolysing)